MLHDAIAISMMLKEHNTSSIAHSHETAMILLEYGHGTFLATCGCFHDINIQIRKVHDKLQYEIRCYIQDENILPLLKEYRKTMYYFKEHFDDDNFVRPKMSRNVMLLICASEIARMRNFNSCYKAHGCKIYDNLNERNISKFFGNILYSLNGIVGEDIYMEFSSQYQKLFIRRFINADENVIVKTNGYSSFILHKENPLWDRVQIDISTLRDKTLYTELFKEKALFIEAQWSANEDNLKKVISKTSANLEQEEIKHYVENSSNKV